jgi:hypothetical protein
MSYPNFSNLQSIYNSMISKVLANDGLTTKCRLNFGVTKKNTCPNCIYDPALKKSSNKYKNGGPVPFTLGKLCPYCNGVGYYGEEKTEDIYLAVISDHKKWINPPANVAIANNMIQTICSVDHLYSIKKCKDLTIILSQNLDNPKYNLFSDPTPVGLGDNKFLFCFWKAV